MGVTRSQSEDPRHDGIQLSSTTSSVMLLTSLQELTVMRKYDLFAYF